MPNKSRRVIGIDPGFDRIGVAIMEKDSVLFSTCIETNRKDAHELRLLQIGESVENIIKKWKPAELAIEKLFFNQNVSTALKVSEARGVLLYVATRAEIKVFEYSPQAIKIAVTGYGKASKDQMESMTMRLTNLKKTPKHDDEMDAIAVGITHLASRRGI